MTDSGGVDFNFSFAPGVLDEQILGFEVAGDVWSQYLHDTYQGEDLDINIYVAVGDDILPDDVVGGAFPAIETGISYRNVYRALQNDFQNEIETETDEIATESLLNVKKLPVLVGEDIVWKNPEMQATRANLKSLGLLDGDDSKLDGFIVMNSLVNVDSVSWNYNYLEGPQAGEIDFLSVAIHELGHNLGFISGVDIKGWNEQSSNFDGKAIDNISTMDLFRYSDESFEAQDGSYTMSINDLTFGRAAYFSLDGTVDNAIAMSTGADYQGSHWQNGDLDTGMGIMNPTVRLGERWEISENDLTVFDAIGWDVDYDADVDLEDLVEDAVEDLYDVDDDNIDLDTLFSNAQFTIDYTRVDRSDDVNDIFSGKAYEWAWRSSSASSSGYWWAWRSSSASSSGYWWAWRSSSASSSGYWSTYGTDALNTDTASTETNTETLSPNTSSTTSDYDPSSLEGISKETLSSDPVLVQNITTTQTKHKKHKWKTK